MTLDIRVTAYEQTTEAYHILVISRVGAEMPRFLALSSSFVPCRPELASEGNKFFRDPGELFLLLLSYLIQATARWQSLTLLFWLAVSILTPMLAAWAFFYPCPSQLGPGGFSTAAHAQYSRQYVTPGNDATKAALLGNREDFGLLTEHFLSQIRDALGGLHREHFIAHQLPNQGGLVIEVGTLQQFAEDILLGNEA